MLQLSQRKRWLAPLALIVGAFLMLFQGVKLLYTNWRLAVVQIVPAMWIWIAMLDIKLHVLHGKQFHVIRGPLLIPCVLGVTALTAASFYLNGVFAFAISVPGQPKIRPAFGRANGHLRVILAWGVHHRPGPVLLRPHHHPLGPLALRHQPEHRRRHHDALLPRRAGPHRRRREEGPVPPGHAGGHRGRRRRRRASSAPRPTCSVASASSCWAGPTSSGSASILIVIGVTLQTGATSAVKAVKFSAKLVGHPGEVGRAPAAG